MKTSYAPKLARVLPSKEKRRGKLSKRFEG